MADELLDPNASPAAMEPVSKQAANYREGDPAHGQCRSCKNFIPPDKCRVVSGVIAPDGVSDFFEDATAQNAGDFLFGPPGGSVPPGAGSIPGSGGLPY